jgi:hypothetical protein
MDALEAIYTTLSPEEQAALWPQAETLLIQDGHKRDFLIRPAILSKIGRLLEAQDTREPRGAPILASDPFPPRTSTAGGSAEALASHAPAAHVAPRSDRKPKGKPPAATLRHILLEDLEDTGRLLVLLDEAREQGLIGKAPADRLTFCAMAAHALRVGKDNPCGLFYRLLHGDQLRLYLSDGDDEAARVRLNVYEYDIDPQRRAPPPPQTSAPPGLSNDARIVADVQREWARLGQSSDAWAYVHAHDPTWTRERWDQAVCELAESQRVWKTTRLVPIEELVMGTDWQASPFPEGLGCVACGEYGPACGCGDLVDGREGECV